jgi:hypothetical protein
VTILWRHLKDAKAPERVGEEERPKYC